MAVWNHRIWVMAFDLVLSWNKVGQVLEDRLLAIFAAEYYFPCAKFCITYTRPTKV